MPKKSVKVPRKSTKSRVNRKLGFEEPSFDGWERWSGEKYHQFVEKYKWMYYSQSNTKEFSDFIVEWMKDHQYSKDDISIVARTKHISDNIAILCRLRTLGMPSFNQKDADYWTSLPATGDSMRDVDDIIKSHVSELITKKNIVEKVEKPSIVKKPSIQDNIKSKAYSMAESVEEVLDEYLKNGEQKKFNSFDPLKEFKRLTVKAPHVRYIRDFYRAEFEEIEKLVNFPSATELKKMSPIERDDWQQLEEGYSHMSNKEVKIYYNFFVKLMDALDKIEEETKTVRKPRKVKPKPPSKLVEKLKYCDKSDEYGISSENPEKIIGAMGILVFNCKNRKLGFYVSNSDSGLSVKGTTIIGFDENISVQKTVRKPNDVLNKIKKATRVRSSTIFKELTTTETKMNGRINSDTVILTVYSK